MGGTAVMTDYQYQTILKSVKMILSGCKSIKEAQEKIDELIGKEDKTEKKEN